MTDLATREPTELEAKDAFAHQQRIQQIARRIREGWVEFIGELWDFKDRHQFRKLGYGSFDEWLADPAVDLDVDRRQVYYYLAVWRTLVVQCGVEPEELKETHITKLVEVEPALRRGQVSKQKALADARELPRSALREEYGGDPVDGPDTSTRIDTGPPRRECPTCGSLVTQDRLEVRDG